MNVDKSPIYAELDRGDGTCRYFDDDSKLCDIYENRPLLCNVDEMYKRFFKDEIPIEEYYKLNYESCKNIKKMPKGGNDYVFINVE